MSSSPSPPPLSDVDPSSSAPHPQRLHALRETGLLDTPPEAAFDRIVRLAAEILDAPIALINLIDADRQWSKASAGIDRPGDVPLEHSFCVHTIEEPGPMVVEDASADPRFTDNRYVTSEPHLRFYAGVPLTAEDGARIGTLCALDTAARSVSDDDLDSLEDLAALVATLIEARTTVAEQARTERTLQRIRTAVAYTTDAVLIMDETGTPIYHNPRFNELFGLTAAELEERGGLRSLLDDAPQAARLWATLRDGTSWTGTVRVRTPDGAPRSVKVNASAVVHGPDEVLGFMAVFADMTRTQRMQQLRSGRNRILRQVVEGECLSAVLRAIVDLLEGQRPDLAGSILLADDGRLQHGAAPHLPDAFVDCVDGIEIGPGAGACGTAAFRNESVVTEDIATDPAWEDYRDVALAHDLRSCWSIPIRGEEGEVLGTFGFYRSEPGRPDDEERTLAREVARIASIAIERSKRERRLHRSEARYRLLAQNVRDVVCLHAPDGTYRWVSPSAREVVGYRPEDIIGTNPFDWIHPDDQDRVRAYHAALEDGRNGDPVRYRFWHEDGHYIWLETLSRLIVVDDGRVAQIQTGSRDVTDRVQRQRDLLEAKQEAEEMNQLKSAFLANMSHEIRTPLTSIIGFAEVLEEEADERHRRMSNLIHRAGSRLMQTLDSVLHLSRLEAGMTTLEREPVDVTAELDETVDLLQPRADDNEVSLRTHTPATSVTAVLDPAALHRILDNVVGNALKFTEPGGRVDVRLHDRDDAVVIQVEDTGVGIDPEFLPRLFDAFKQEQSGTSRTYEGSGLGLTVVRRLVDLHDGEIDVESAKGEGSRFTISLPHVQDDQARGNASGKEPKPDEEEPEEAS